MFEKLSHLPRVFFWLYLFWFIALYLSAANFRPHFFTFAGIHKILDVVLLCIWHPEHHPLLSLQALPLSSLLPPSLPTHSGSNICCHLLAVECHNSHIYTCEKKNVINVKNLIRINPCYLQGLYNDYIFTLFTFYFKILCTYCLLMCTEPSNFSFTSSHLFSCWL